MAQGSRGSVSRAAVLLAAGYAALVLAWALGSPLNTGPDESQHYNKAVAAGHGEITGLAVRRPAPQTPVRLYWITLTTRVFTTPGVLAEREKSPCEAFRPLRSAQCPAPPIPSANGVRSYTGTYQPFVYVPVGAVAARAGNLTTAFRLARVTSAALCLLLLALAALTALRVSSGERSIALAGFVVALPPMALFMFSVVNPNGPEIAAGVCFAAGLVGLTRLPRSPLAWSALVVGGVVLALARSLGPFWLVFGLLVAAVDLGKDGVRRPPRRAVVASGAVLATAVAACAWWEATRQPHLPVTVHDTVHNLPTALGEVPALLRQTVGVFGWNDARLPMVVYVAAWAVALGLGICAMVVGSARERFVLVAASVALLVAGVVISAAVLHREGFAMQARYLLPPAAIVPMYAAETLRRHRDRLPAVARHLVLSVVPVAAVVQVVSWLANARRYAAGSHGPIVFLGRSEWHPAYGWTPWLLLAVLGAGLLAAAAVTRPGAR